MHQAPALAFQVGRSAVHGYLLIGLAGVSLMTGVLWLLPIDDAGWRQALFFVSWLLVLGIAVRQWQHWPSGELIWDGAAWRWQGTGLWATEQCHGLLRPQLDWQVGLLLSLQPDSGKRIWLWAQCCDDAQQWAALRRAVFAPVRSAEPTPNDDAGQAVNH